MATDERFELHIDKVVAGGEGIGRHDGLVVFVPGVAPGERVLVEPMRRRRDFVQARLVKVLEPSPRRREPPCPFYRECGGCSLMHLDAEAQRDVKREILRESLARNGNVDFRGTIEMRHGPELGYRVRARFHVRLTRRGPVVGFRQRRSHRIVDVDECLQLTPSANAVLTVMRQWLAEEPRRAEGMLGFEILEPVDTRSSEPGKALVHLRVRRGRSHGTASLERLAERASLSGLVISDEEGRRRGGWGSPILLHHVAGRDLQASAGGFFQANRFLLEELTRTVVADAVEREARVVDLHCGVGLFTLGLAARAHTAYGVDVSAPSVADARANARRAGFDQLHLRCVAASDFSSEGGLDGASLVVADPPRGGLEKDVIEALCQSPPRELRYVSCDPAAFGRDAGRLTSRGWKLDRLVVFDLFPNTHHFETIGVFVPSPEKASPQDS